MSSDGPDDRPTIIALAGSNGAGKSTFYETQLACVGERLKRYQLEALQKVPIWFIDRTSL
jgi:ABC-type Mn2+/Zn2+ transport system ATPase subunit